MKFATILILFIASLSFAGEGMPDLDAYLASSTTEIETPKFELKAPRISGTIKGFNNLKADRTTEEIAETVRMNQGRLNYLYKTWKVRKDNTINRYFNLTLTINPDGTVSKITVKGPKNKEFIQEVSEIILTWTFDKVANPKPKTVTLRNLDFMYRNALVID